MRAVTFIAAVRGRVVALATALFVAACATELASLTPEQAAAVRVGDSREAILERLGAPVSTTPVRRRQQEVWTYRVYDRGQVQRHQNLFVYFDPATDQVVRVERASDPAFDPGMTRTSPRRASE